MAKVCKVEAIHNNAGKAVTPDMLDRCQAGITMAQDMMGDAIRYVAALLKPEVSATMLVLGPAFGRDLMKGASTLHDNSNCSRLHQARLDKHTRHSGDVFQKEYIYISLVHDQHCSLLIVCHPGRLLQCAKQRMSKVKRQQQMVFLHLDSKEDGNRGPDGLIINNGIYCMTQAIIIAVVQQVCLAQVAGGVRCPLHVASTLTSA
eukprot:jgi/Chrzof1/4084/Cz13g19180.t1